MCRTSVTLGTWLSSRPKPVSVARVERLFLLGGCFSLGFGIAVPARQRALWFEYSRPVFSRTAIQKHPASAAGYHVSHAVLARVCATAVRRRPRSGDAARSCHIFVG